MDTTDALSLVCLNILDHSNTTPCGVCPTLVSVYHLARRPPRWLVMCPDQTFGTLMECTDTSFDKLGDMPLLGEGVEKYGEGVETYGEGVETYGEGVENYGEGVENYGEGVETYGEGVENYGVAGVEKETSLENVDDGCHQSVQDNCVGDNEETCVKNVDDGCHQSVQDNCVGRNEVTSLGNVDDGDPVTKRPMVRVRPLRRLKRTYRGTIKQLY